MFWCLMAPLMTLTAKDFYGFTQERPLIIVYDWDFRPFEFVDSDGNPSGYNVDVLGLILNRLEIPHRFVMREWHEASVMFERREADLIHALSYHYKRRPYIQTQKYVNYYTVKTVRRFDTPPLLRLANLTRHDTVVLKRDDYASLRLQAVMGDSSLTVLYTSPKDGLTGVRAGRYPYYIWGEAPLLRKIQELGLDSLVLEDIDIPTGELRIIGYEPDIIEAIDDQYTRLEQAGELQKIYDKWFHPERVHDDTSPWAVIALVAVAIVGLIVFLLIRLTKMRVNAAIRQSSELHRMMDQALEMGEYFVLEWDINGNLLRNKYGNLLPDEGMLPQEFLGRLDAGQGEYMHNINMQLIKGENDYEGIQVRFNRGTAVEPEWYDLAGKAIAERKNGQAYFIVYSAKDITREREEERRYQSSANRYKMIFDTNLVAMAFYDEGGRFIDSNQKMHALCKLEGDNAKFFHDTLLFELAGLKGDYLPQSRETFYVCRRLYYPALDLDKYVEMRIRPVIDDEERLVYYILTARDISVERDVYMKQVAHNRQLQQANDAISHYEQQLQYLLEEGNMYVWTLNLQTKVVSFFRTLSTPDFVMTLSEYFEAITASERDAAVQHMQDVFSKGTPFTGTHLMDRTPVNSEPTWYAISGMPLKAADGTIKEYFGIVRNITELMQAQELLRRETSRAEDSGRMKAAFLANMTHEIRTPLNAIVGFSQLLQMVDTPEERHEFIRIIRNNCDMLLRLINDILEASSMGQSLAIEPEPVDLSSVFSDICQTLAQRVQEPGVEFQKDCPYDTCPAVLDKGRLQQLLTNFVTNAVKYTKEGHIRVGFRCTPMSDADSTALLDQGQRDMISQNNATPGLYFYCEDTGTGIPKEKQPLVFERFVKLNDFVQGTGLGLSICRAIVEKIGGYIGVTGDVGIGSTFWFWIPKEMKDLES